MYVIYIATNEKNVYLFISGKVSAMSNIHNQLKYTSATIIIVIFIVLVVENALALRYGHVYLELPKFALDFNYEFDSEERKGATVEGRSSTNTYSEILDIQTGGWIFLPALAVYRLTLSPEWEQMRTEPVSGKKKGKNSFRLGYSGELTLLKDKPYTLQLFAKRSRSTVSTSFSEKNKSETDVYGATLFLKYPVLPTNISYKHNESDQSGFFVSSRVKDEITLYSKNDGFIGKTELNTLYTEEETTTRGTSQKYSQYQIDLNNSYILTENKNITLGSRLGYRQSEGVQDSSAFNVSERVVWKHKKDLKSEYSLRYDTSKSGDIERDVSALAFGLSAVPVQNLTASVFASGSFSNSTAFKENRYSTGLGLNYKKEFSGAKVTFSSKHSFSVVDRSEKAEFTQVFDEAVTVTNNRININAALSNENIDIDSIIVRDSPGGVPFVKDLHYRLTERGNSVIVSCIIGGAIDIPVGSCSSGVTVFVDYRFRNNPFYDFSVFKQGYSINAILWSDWRIYYSYSQSTQRFISGISPDELPYNTVHILGSELKWKWSKTRVEYKNTESTSLPSESFRMSETISFRPSQRTHLSASGRYSSLKLKDTGERSESYGLASGFQWAPKRNLSFGIDASHGKSFGSISETEHNEFSSFTQWFYGIWSAKLRYDFSMESDSQTNEETKRQLVFFKLSRQLY